MALGEANPLPLFNGSFEPPIRPCAKPTGLGPKAVAVRTVIPSDFAAALQVLEEIATLLAARAYDERDCFAIRLALDEALVNAIKHGNQMNPNKQVLIAYCVTDDRVEITIEDQGPGFNPDEVADPLANEHLERPCGRGLLLMRHYMSDVMFHPPGNKVTLSKLRKTPNCNRNA